jgi:non-heme chloroperoxidase
MDGNDRTTYAGDLAGLVEHLDLRDVVLVGHSTGGGGVTRYMGRHGTSRVAKAVLLSATHRTLRHSAGQTDPEGLLAQRPLSGYDC